MLFRPVPPPCLAPPPVVVLCPLASPSRVCAYATGETERCPPGSPAPQAAKRGRLRHRATPLGSSWQAAKPARLPGPAKLASAAVWQGEGYIAACCGVLPLSARPLSLSTP